MKTQLFREMFELNQTFEQLIRALKKLEKVRRFNGELIRYARADVESARVDANREFFDNFDAIVGNDAVWAYRFQREYNRKTKDPDEVYLEIKDSEERRKTKGLPPRLVILPGWNMSDEERYDEEQAEKKKRAARKQTRATKQRKASAGGNKSRARAAVAPTREGQANQ